MSDSFTMCPLIAVSPIARKARIARKHLVMPCAHLVPARARLHTAATDDEYVRLRAETDHKSLAHSCTVPRTIGDLRRPFLDAIFPRDGCILG